MQLHSRVFLIPVPGFSPTLQILDVSIIEIHLIHLINTSRIAPRTEMGVSDKRETSKCVFLGDIQEQSWDTLLQKLCKVKFLVLTWCSLE